jgi:hypothetical protein
MPNATGNNGAARVKLQRKYFDALLADFAEHGEAAIKIMRIEEPSAYIRVIASLMPKEFTVTDNALGDMSDEDLQQLLARAQAMLKIVDASSQSSLRRRLRGASLRTSSPTSRPTRSSASSSRRGRSIANAFSWPPTASARPNAALPRCLIT